MGIGKIVGSGVSKIASGVKTVAKSVVAKAPTAKGDAKQLTKAMDALSAQGKAFIKKAAFKPTEVSKELSGALTNAADSSKVLKHAKDVALDVEKKVSKLEMASAKTKSMDKFVEEGIKSGLNPKQAVNGAKAVLAATGEESGKYAMASATAFVDGLTQAEKKAELLEKYGEKLQAKKAAEVFKASMEEARNLY